jgi:hypothetical protein
MGNRYRIKPSRIKSLEDLHLEKSRVKLEIMKKAEEIRSDYRNMLNVLTFKSIISTVAENFTFQSAALSKVVSIGRSIFSGRRKKKRE